MCVCVWVRAHVRIIKNYAFFPFSFFARRVNSAPNRIRSLSFFTSAIFRCVVCKLVASTRILPHILDELCFSRQIFIIFFCCSSSRNSSLLILFNVRLSTYFCVNILVDSRFYRIAFFGYAEIERGFCADMKKKHVCFENLSVCFVLRLICFMSMRIHMRAHSHCSFEFTSESRKKKSNSEFLSRAFWGFTVQHRRLSQRARLRVSLLFSVVHIYIFIFRCRKHHFPSCVSIEIIILFLSR